MKPVFPGFITNIPLRLFDAGSRAGYSSKI